MDKTEIASKLVAIRKQKALSQQELSNKSGVTLRTIQRIEAAAVHPHLQTLSLLAAALEIDAGELTVQERFPMDARITNRLVLLHATPLIGFVVPMGGVIGPFIWWLYQRKEDKEFDRHGKSIINFQITMSILFCIAFLMTFFQIPGGIFLLVGSYLYNVILVLINAWKVSKEKQFNYPMSIRFFKQDHPLIQSGNGRFSSV